MENEFGFVLCGTIIHETHYLIERQVTLTKNKTYRYEREALSEDVVSYVFSQHGMKIKFEKALVELDMNDARYNEYNSQTPQYYIEAFIVDQVGLNLSLHSVAEVLELLNIELLNECIIRRNGPKEARQLSFS